MLNLEGKTMCKDAEYINYLNVALNGALSMTSEKNF